MPSNMITLVGVCPRCGEAVEVDLSKKEIKDIYHGFKTSVLQANILSEKKLQVKYDWDQKVDKLRESLSKVSPEEAKVLEEAKQILRKYVET